MLAAVSILSLPVQGMTILPEGFTCGLPFSEGFLGCPGPNSGPAAYVSFVGTDKVAAVVIGTERGGPVIAATVEAFQGPPGGWSMPVPEAIQSPAPSPAASPSITCVPELVTLPSGPSMPDECPTAIIAFEAVAARLGTLARIRIEPGTFDCADLWPGVGSPPICFGAFILAGSAMHGWASFVGTDKVAAIALRRSPIGPIPQATSFGPWVGPLSAFVVPPAGWVMP